MTKLHEKITKQKEYRLNEREKIFKLTKLTTKWFQDVTNQLYHVTKQLKDRYDILKKNTSKQPIEKILQDYNSLRHP